MAREYWMSMQQCRGGCVRLLLFSVSTGAPWPLVSIAGRRVAMARWALIAAGQGGTGCSLSHLLTRREHCACRQHYMVQLHLLQTAKLHLKVRGAKISISSET